MKPLAGERAGDEVQMIIKKADKGTTKNGHVRT